MKSSDGKVLHRKMIIKQINNKVIKCKLFLKDKIYLIKNNRLFSLFFINFDSSALESDSLDIMISQGYIRFICFLVYQFNPTLNNSTYTIYIHIHFIFIISSINMMRKLRK